MTVREHIRIIRKRVYSWQACFMDEHKQITPAAEIALLDLAHFCRLDRSTAVISPVTKSIDPLAMAMAEGRREVGLRIVQMLGITPQQLANLKEPIEERDDYAA